MWLFGDRELIREIMRGLRKPMWKIPAWLLVDNVDDPTPLSPRYDDVTTPLPEPPLDDEDTRPIPTTKD